MSAASRTTGAEASSRSYGSTPQWRVRSEQFLDLRGR
jgi:hypothetical protein